MMHQLQEYRQLLDAVDCWFESCLDSGKDVLACRKGCSACCKALFDINLLDAWLLREGFAALSKGRQQQVLERCKPRLTELTTRWPALRSPYFLNASPSEEWMEMPETDQTPCPLLDEEGRCLVYAFRPLVCRLHGLPHIDISGEDFSGVVCSLHPGDPSSLPEDILRWRFREVFSKEVSLFRSFADDLTGGRYQELDTFIPLALLADYDDVNWKALKI